MRIGNDERQQRERVGLVVVSGVVAVRSSGGDNRGLVGVAAAGGVLLDRAHRHAGVWDLVVLAPGCQRGQEAAIGVRSV